MERHTRPRTRDAIQAVTVPMPYPAIPGVDQHHLPDNAATAVHHLWGTQHQRP